VTQFLYQYVAFMTYGLMM